MMAAFPVPMRTVFAPSAAALEAAALLGSPHVGVRCIASPTGACTNLDLFHRLELIFEVGAWCQEGQQWLGPVRAVSPQGDVCLASVAGHLECIDVASLHADMSALRLNMFGVWELAYEFFQDVYQVVHARRGRRHGGQSGPNGVLR